MSLACAKIGQLMRSSVYIATSLDGFIAREDGGVDWLSSVQRDGEDYGYAAFMKSVDVLVIGRKTYDLARTFDAWRYGGKKVVVLTHRPTAPVHGEEFVAGNPEDIVGRLAAEGLAHAYIDGGATIQQFLAAGIVTDITISVVPVLLGAGIRLFGEAEKEARLKLTSSKAFESGLVQVTYAVSS